MNDKILLVEGIADEGFFSALCRVAGLGVKVTVGNPKSFGGGGTGKGNALTLLPTLIDGMRDGSIKRLAMVIDADFDATGGLGYKETLKRVAIILRDQGYKTSLNITPQPGGHYFKHSNGLPDFGLWIMPNNSSDGFLEDFIKDSVSATQKALLKEAESAVRKLKIPLFKPIHQSKADVATWMAWQKVPGQALQGVVGEGLIDLTLGTAKQLKAWMDSIYK